jgi:hypothetical protein
VPQFVRDARSAFFERAAQKRLRNSDPARPGRPHGLTGELIVSLTSFPPRFNQLKLTLGCLFDQTVRADRITLWIAEEDRCHLPGDVISLRETDGFEILTCEDIGPYKKLIPALEAFPNAFIATADDDNYYPRNWLESLVRAYDGSSVVCCVGWHNGRAVPSWSDLHPSKPSLNIQPFGCGGTLYPPHCFPDQVTDRSLFMKLCPTGDDIWWHWMLKTAGTKVKTAGRRRSFVALPGTQEMSLSNTSNVDQGKAMFAAISAALPMP